MRNAAPTRSTGRAGYGRLVDGGDLGDSYNYSPPRQDTLVDEPVAVSVRVVEPGPVRATVEITATYVWPDHVDGSSQRARRASTGSEVETRSGAQGGRGGRQGHDVVRQPESGSPAPGASPAARAGADIPGRERVRGRRAGTHGRRAGRRIRVADRAGRGASSPPAA